MSRRWWLAAVAALLVGGVLALVLTQGGGPAPRPARTSPATTTTPPSTTTVPPSPLGQLLGANTGRLFNGQPYPASQVLTQLAALHATGSTVARSDALWEATEPSPPTGGVHHYQWAFDDTIAGSLALAGLTWLPIVDYAPPWAVTPGSGHPPPKGSDQYAAYAGALAARYGPGGEFWRTHPTLTPRPADAYEIWNEPDNSAFWSPAPSPPAYAELFLAARQAIHAVQPDARVIVGGLTKPAKFLPALLAAAPALGERLDGVAIHPYGSTPQEVLTRVRRARRALAALGLSTVPLYVTEFGWTTHPPGALDYLPERLRPGYIGQTLTELEQSGCGVAAVLLYAWVTPESNPQDPQDWFGVSPPGGGSSPDSEAFAQAVKAAPQAAPAGAAC